MYKVIISTYTYNSNEITQVSAWFFNIYPLVRKHALQFYYFRIYLIWIKYPPNTIIEYKHGLQTHMHFKWCNQIYNLLYNIVIVSVSLFHQEEREGSLTFSYEGWQIWFYAKKVPVRNLCFFTLVLI